MTRIAYEIRVEGDLPARLLEDFDSLTIVADPTGTVMRAFLSDEAELHGILDALRRVAAGGTALDPEVVTELFARDHGRQLDALTPREREVLALMAQGHANASTSPPSSRSSACHPPTPATAASWPCWPTSTPDPM